MASRKDIKDAEGCKACSNQTIICVLSPDRFKKLRSLLQAGDFKTIEEEFISFKEGLSKLVIDTRFAIPAEVPKCRDAYSDLHQRFYDELQASLCQNWYHGPENIAEGLRRMADFYSSRLEEKYDREKHHVADKLLSVLDEMLAFFLRCKSIEINETEENNVIRAIEKTVPLTSNALSSDVVRYNALAVYFADRYMFRSAEDMLIGSRTALNQAVVPIAYRLKFCFACWFYTKQLLKVTANDTNRRRLKDSMKTAQMSLMECLYDDISSCQYERLSLLQRMLFTVLGIETYGSNLSNYEVSSEDLAVAQSLLTKSAEMYESFNLSHKLHFCLAQAKFLSITGNISKSTEYVKEIEALITEIDCKDCQAMMRGCLERFKQTLHADNQRKAGQTEDEVATSIGDSLNIGLVAYESFEKDHDLSVWPFLLEDVMLKDDTYTETAKRNNFLIQNVVICPSAAARENIMQIPELLKTGGLIPRLIIDAIQLALQTKDRKKAHELLLSVARYIKQADADNIVDAWPAYKENKPWDPIFVVLTISNFQGEWEEILGFPVFKRRYDFVSSEAAIVVNSKKVAENLLDYSDFNKLKNVTHSREVIEKHSNITIMNACSFRSKSGGKEIYKETCVVIHCLVKGLIPFQEEPFPRNISGIPVDVREGYVTMGMKPGESGGQYVDVDRMSPEGAVSQDVDCEIVDHVQSPKYKAEYHSMCEKMQNLDLVGPCVQMGTRSTDVNQNLLMGTTISRTGSIPLTGTLGGFVRLHGGDMGFVTCAHVVGLTKGQTVSQPSHAELPPSHRSPGTICGHVEDAIFAPGHCDETGIDAAVVRISKRQPTDGEFIWVSPESQDAAGFSSTLKFTSGKVLTRAELKENRRTDVIKVGSQSGLTRGSLYLTESFIRINNREMILPGGETVEFYNQMEIQSHYGSKAFFELGDSGSLVFMALKNNELHCIGLAIGKTSYSSCLVTPISDVLHRLGLQDQLLQFGVLHGPPSNGFHLPNGRL